MVNHRNWLDDSPPSIIVVRVYVVHEKSKKKLTVKKQLGSFVTFLSLTAFQLGRGGQAPWLRL